jgi:hypothetical protein
MGTQQILLIVLSVIIVGVAIAVGITMFSNQAYNGNQQAVASELQNYGSQAIQYYKTPKSQGGAGQDSTEVTVAKVATFLGFTGTNNSLTSDNGEFRVTAVAGTTVTLKGKGVELKSGKNPLITTTISLAAGTITSSVSSGTTF